MIDKETFCKVIKELREDVAYKDKLADITREYQQENTYCFSSTNESAALDLLLKYVLDEEWQFDTIWDFVLEGKAIFIIKDKDVVCKTPEELYEVITNV